MKKIYYPTFLSLITLFLLSGCGFTEELTEVQGESPEGRERAYIVSLEDTDTRVAKDVWSKFIKDHKGRLRRIKGSDIEVAPAVEISGFSDKVTVKSGFRDQGRDTELQLWFVRDERYLNPNSDQTAFDIIDRFVEQYRSSLESAQIQNEVDDEQKKLKQLEKDLSRLQRQNDQLHKDITKAEDKIRESRIKIEDNLQEQDMINQQIGEQKRVVEETKRKMP